jgi:hypothetical protein
LTRSELSLYSQDVVAARQRSLGFIKTFYC